METPHFKPLIASAGEIRSLQALVESRALPVLQRSRTLGELDALIHREGLFPRDARRRFVALIIARLAGNPDFEALAQQMQHSYEKGDKETTDKLQRLIDHLRDKAAPAV